MLSPSSMLSNLRHLFLGGDPADVSLFIDAPIFFFFFFLGGGVGFLGLVVVLWCNTLYPSSFAIILMRKKELVSLLYLSSWCIVAVGVMWFFLTVPSVVCDCVFSNQTHSLFYPPSCNFEILKIENTWLMSFDIKFAGQGFEKVCWHGEVCRAIQHTFSKVNLVNLISKDANLVFYLSVYPSFDSSN